ncbi:hypothetical protein IHN32_00360 [Deinococcus sp. 14RED07]|uniref:hypothetical protein n=1 Tax=unclassified Deinococcus TaxID=2623546 RepID=UPI001E5D13D1|nr:hypothetical protein [Deinococcus sp. 14RED07]MCD0174409.1 hypothetical protein [Deinococcus sp. 14RED07]
MDVSPESRNQPVFSAVRHKSIRVEDVKQLRPVRQVLLSRHLERRIKLKTCLHLVRESTPE